MVETVGCGCCGGTGVEECRECVQGSGVDACGEECACGGNGFICDCPAGEALAEAHAANEVAA